MSKTYTIGGDPEDFKRFVDGIRITSADTKAELLAQIVGELAIMNGTYDADHLKMNYSFAKQR